MIRLSVLDESEIEAIHQATLRILSETGVVLTEPKSRELLTGEGAKVQDKRVLFPADLVAKCIAISFSPLAALQIYWMLLPESAAQPPSRMCGIPPGCWMRWKTATPSLPSLPRRKCPAESCLWRCTGMLCRTLSSPCRDRACKLPLKRVTPSGWRR